MDLVRLSDRLSADLRRLRFAPPTACVYDPTDYARAATHRYLERWGAGRPEVVLLGMNPGPFGMAQTGVPFGDPAAVRGWLGIEAPVGRPDPEHPRRPILGFASPRTEVSGARVWGWARDRFGTPDRFFARFFVANYCPLCFLEASGRNRTPDHLPPAERAPLFARCDAALRDLVDRLQPRWVIGFGRFAEARARAALTDRDVRIGHLLHPSPASPAANRGWAAEVDRGLRALGVAIPAGPLARGPAPA